MPITFAPLTGKKRNSEAGDLVVSLRTSKKHKGLSLELCVSKEIQNRLRYLDGDRCVVHFNEEVGSACIERIASGHGYKICLQERADGGAVALIRVTCDEGQAKLILGEETQLTYQIYEVDGAKVTFVSYPA